MVHPSSLDIKTTTDSPPTILGHKHNYWWSTHHPRQKPTLFEHKLHPPSMDLNTTIDGPLTILDINKTSDGHPPSLNTNWLLIPHPPASDTNTTSYNIAIKSITIKKKLTTFIVSPVQYPLLSIHYPYNVVYAITSDVVIAVRHTLQRTVSQLYPSSYSHSCLSNEARCSYSPLR